MDYARLRDEGLRLLGRLGGAQWTDFNTHDPGITILEQLCYAITDLGYRTAYPVPDLLAGGDPGLPGPEAILTSDPVTLADVQTLALDVEGIGNAWVEEPADPDVPFYYHAGSGELRLRADPTDADAAPVQLRGLHRVILQTTQQLTGEAALTSASARLHAGRGLGSDFDVVLMATYEVGLRATIEVDAVEDPTALMVDIVERIETYLAPSARFLTVAEARAQNRSIEEIFDGPLLAHGFVDLLPEQRRTVYVSDLLHAILDVPTVKAVRSLVLPGTATASQHWALEIPPGKIPTLAPTAELTLVRRDLPLRVDLAEVRRRVEQRRGDRARAATATATETPPPQPRDLVRHRSIQYQLPAAYGVGPLGLPASAAPERRAQARQLAAYLLVFDQLFANALAQLAHARELLAPDDGPTRTYFAQVVDDDRLGIAELRVQDPASHRAWLDGAIESGNPLERRKRFLAHLLARFAEELGDHSMIQAPIQAMIRRTGVSTVREADEILVADRRAFLRAYPRLSRARGSGYDVSRHGSPGAVAGFEERLRHKLGLHDRLRLHVVEHVLLRPLVEDRAQLADEGDPQVPLLAGVAGPDPWSLNVSIVLEEPEKADPSFEQFVEQTIMAETPAHLTVHLHWFGKTGVDNLTAFERAWDDFRAAYRDYREIKLRGSKLPVILPLRVRDARDRAIDLLGFGRTYPLRDLPLPEQIVVTPGAQAKISIEFSQDGVTYELRDRDSGKRVLNAGTPITAEGNGGLIELVTPPIDVDKSYRILAIKHEDPSVAEPREAWLRTVVRVVEGVDSALVADIWLPLLDSRIDNARPSDARIGNWGVQAEVEVLASQEGVTYELIEHAKDLSDITKHHVVSAPVIGTSGTIVLRTVAIQEDIDLRVRGKKATGSPANPVMRTGILDLVLPLRVRANPAVPAQLVPPVVVYGGAAVVRLGTTQASAEYRVYRGRVRDGDFVFGAGAGVQTIDVPGDGGTVRVKRPSKPAVWQDLTGFAPVGDATRGNSGARDLAIGAPGTDDAFLLVQASKQHESGPLGTGSEKIGSAVQLTGALALLVRPNPRQALHLDVVLANGATTGSLQVSGGQPGVFYELRLDGAPTPVGRPAYFHQRDDQSDQLNKGIDQLRIKVDAVIARDASAAGDPRATPPAVPLLDTAPLPAGSVLGVVAHKAMTGLQAPLEHHAILDDVPTITAVPASVARGESADITIDASRIDERYWLTRNGMPVGDVKVGTGARIALPTGALQDRAVFTVAVMRERADALAVERHVDIAVDVV